MDEKVPDHGASAHPGTGGVETVLGAEDVGDLGPVVLRHPPGTFRLTPASRIAVEAVVAGRDLLRGTGIDWGAGVGGLAILAARLPGVDRVVGLELSRADVEAARANARRNGVDGLVRFVAADSFTPLDTDDGPLLRDLRGRVDFLLANPPASTGDDGFGFRRRILREARAFLRPGAVALLQISSQYGLSRIRRLEDDAPGFRWSGSVASTGPVPFDLERPDLLECLELYAGTEEAGGDPYAFTDARGAGMTAREALERYHAGGGSPLSRWQVHAFRFDPLPGGSGTAR